MSTPSTGGLHWFATRGRWSPGKDRSCSRRPTARPAKIRTGGMKRGVGVGPGGPEEQLDEGEPGRGSYYLMSNLPVLHSESR